MLLIILPLAKKGKEVKQKVIEQVVDLAKQIEDENTQVFVITGILVSSDKFIDRDYAKSVRRYLSMTKVFQSLEEEKLEAVNIAKRNERHDTNVEIAKSLLRDGIDTVVIMRATGFSKEQIEEILSGFRYGLTYEQVAFYAKEEFDCYQMRTIKRAFLYDNLTVEEAAVCAIPSHNTKKMRQEIRKIAAQRCESKKPENCNCEKG